MKVGVQMLIYEYRLQLPQTPSIFQDARIVYCFFESVEPFRLGEAEGGEELGVEGEEEGVEETGAVGEEDESKQSFSTVQL